MEQRLFGVDLGWLRSRWLEGAGRVYSWRRPSHHDLTQLDLQWNRLELNRDIINILMKPVRFSRPVLVGFMHAMYSVVYLTARY